MKTYTYFWSYLAQSFLEWETFLTKVVEKIKTHIFCSVTFFENRAVYEIMWKNIVQRGRPQMAILLTRIACWILKATNTHTLRTCNIDCFFHCNNNWRTRFSVTLHVNCLPCWLFSYLKITSQTSLTRMATVLTISSCSSKKIVSYF
jgi:hypothetical protein